jgi:hypothetical protein
MLLALVLAASGVSLFTPEELAQKPRPSLKAHLLELDGELYLLEQSLSITGGDIFLKSSGEAAPWVALAGAPALAIGFLLQPTSGTSGQGPVVQTGVIVATALLGTALLAAIVYGVTKMLLHSIDLGEWGARQKALFEYRPRVVNALATAPPGAADPNRAPPRD